MSLSKAIFDTMATALGLKDTEVFNVGRSIREAGLFTVETRSPKSPRAGERDCARLLLALMAGASTRRAADVVRIFEPTEIAHGCIKHITDWPNHRDYLSGHLAIFAEPGHGMVDAVAELIRHFRIDPDGHGRALAGSFIEVDHRRLCGTIELMFFEYEEKEFGVIADYLNYRYSDFLTGDLTVKAAISMEPLIALARCLNRGTSA